MLALLFNLPHQRAHEISEGDDARRASVLIHDHRNVAPQPSHVLEQVIGHSTLGDGEDRLNERSQIEGRIAPMPDQVPQMDGPEDIVE